ncbi:hypothetical protein G3I15_53470, partial [Streptomyces sp. SID10244]|nr:hypothetical protein [Streptomyces sp. SID10244]
IDVYSVQVIIQIAGGIDVSRMRRAAGELFRAHPVLRSAYVRTADGTPVTVVPPVVEPDWQTVDLSSVDDRTAQSRLADLAGEQRTTRFDLARPGPIRFVAVAMPSGDH